MKKIILLILILTLSCKEKKNNKKQNNERVEINKQSEKREIKYITAKSGLIYRDKPKGKRLGKFEFNDIIIITEHTNIFQKIENGNKIINGEWLGTTIANKNVYIHSGFLSTTKNEITPRLVKYFMADKIWLSNEFKEILEKTKLISRAYNESKFHSDIAYSDDYGNDKKPGLFCDTNQMEPDYFEIDFSLESDIENKIKIISINNKTLVLEKDNKQYTFNKSETKIRSEFYKLGGVQKASSDYIHKWINTNFKGNFILKNENGSKKYNAKNIFYYHEFFNGDIVEINNKIYSVDKLIQKTYYLSEIAFDGMDEIEMKKTGKTATLTKILKK